VADERNDAIDCHDYKAANECDKDNAQLRKDLIRFVETFFAAMVLIKILRANEVHYGFQYKTGENVDTRPWNTNKPCSPGGLYCCKKQDALDFCELYEDAAWVRVVLDHSPMHVEDAENGWPVKFKAHRLTLGEREPLADFIAREFTTNAIIRALCRNYGVLAHVHQTPELCLAAVSAHGFALGLVKERTPELCLAAVTNTGRAIKFVTDAEQTPEVCRAAVAQHGCALQYVKDPTPELCLAAVMQNGYALEIIKEQTAELCLAAVTENGFALKFVKEQTHEVCLAAVTENGYALQYVMYQTPEVRLAARAQNPYSVEFET